MTLSSEPSIVVFHDNFAQMGGAERVAEELHRAFPGATLATTLSVPKRLSTYLQHTPIKTTWMQFLPVKAHLFRSYFLLYPFAVESIDLRKYDLILSSCFGYAKGIKRRKDALHICYCHTPMRWVWRTSDYLERERISNVLRPVLRLALKALKIWEIRASRRPDFYISNSQEVARRLHSAFGVSSTIINPPINTDRFSVSAEVDDYYLVLSRLVPYKRIDLAIEACRRTHRHLKILGSGRDFKRLRQMAGPTIDFIGRQSDSEVARVLSRCRALIIPGEEDFCMTLLEANASGRPAIAFKGGGALETIQDGLNGMFFEEATVESLIASLQRFEAKQWSPSDIRTYSEAFGCEIFRERIRQFVERVAHLRTQSIGDTLIEKTPGLGAHAPSNS